MKDKIHSSGDYNLFSMREGHTARAHVDKVIESIRKKNCSPDYPILVDDGMKIIEGRYRFLALKALRLPIYYKISEVTTETDALRIKHINRNADPGLICEIFSDMPQYNDIILLYHEFSGSFDHNFIIKASHACDWNGWGIHRIRLASGEMGAVDAEATRMTLNKILFLTGKYAYMPNVDAFWIVNHLLQNKPDLFVQPESTTVFLDQACEANDYIFRALPEIIRSLDLDKYKCHRDFNDRPYYEAFISAFYVDEQADDRDKIEAILRMEIKNSKTA